MKFKTLFAAAPVLFAAGILAAQAQPFHRPGHLRPGAPVRGYCDRLGCPDGFWNLPVYYGRVFYDGYWFNGPLYYRDWHGRRQYWLRGGWRFDGWTGPRPRWWREGRYGPALGRGFYAGPGFRAWGDDDNRAPWRVTRHGDETDYDVPGDILFALDSAQVSARANDVIADIASDAAGRPRAVVEVDGYTDTSGDAAHNQRLSEARAGAVATVLEQHGVAQARIRTRGYGETQLAVPTADGVREAQNRRVVIRIIGR